MTELTDFLDVKDTRSDEELKALANLVNFCRKDGKKINWKSLRREFSNHYWKPKIKRVKGAKFPYHAYAVSKDGIAEKEGEYKKRKTAESYAMDYAMCLEGNL